MRELKADTLVCGKCRHFEIMTIRTGRLAPADYHALPMLIQHPEEGLVLFDTGYDPDFFTATMPLPERAYRWMTPVNLPPGAAARDQIERAGFVASDVHHVILSHFHGDHMAGLKQFPNAAIHCAEAGYAAACRGSRVSAVRQGILRALIPADFARRARFFEQGTRVSLPGALKPFEDGVDIFGDGSILAIELPGHCVGHWGIVFNDAAFGLHMLIADAAWSSKAVRENVPPPSVTSNFLGQARGVNTTLAKLHALHRRAPDIRLSPYHCPERAAEAKASRP